MIQYGNGNYSIASASRFYFGKEPTTVTLNEAITIAALLPNPQRYNPIDNPRLFRLARHVALRKMVGCGILRKNDTQLFEQQEYDAMGSSVEFATYQQLFAMLWYDGAGERKINVPNLCSPLFNRIFRGETTSRNSFRMCGTV